MNTPELTAYERWMVASNLRTAQATGVTPRDQAALLRANGYSRVADAVEASCAEEVES